MTVKDRWEFVREHQLCTNCLANSHLRSQCRSKVTCAECEQHHHTLLHRLVDNRPRDYQPRRLVEYKKKRGSSSSSSSSSCSTTSSSSGRSGSRSGHCTGKKRSNSRVASDRSAKRPSSSANRSGSSMHSALSRTPSPKARRASSGTPPLDESPQSLRPLYSGPLIDLQAMTPVNVLLPTAVVFLNGPHCCRKIRLLLSPGLPHSIILESTVQAMSLDTSTSLGEYVANVRLQSRYNEDVIRVRASVRSQLNIVLPRASIDEEIKGCYDRLPLADPTFYHPVDIEMVLGAEVYSEILRGGIVQSAAKLPTAFSTVFGWAIVGSFTQLE